MFRCSCFKNKYNMSEKKGKKRSKSYYIKCAGGKKAKHVNDLDVGMKGFLVTCNKYERETVREMYNILNEYADQIYGPEKPKKSEKSDDESEEEDMEKAMQKEALEIKETKGVRRFQNTDTKTKNLIFIRTTLDSPCELAHKMLTEMFDSQIQKARYALRMLPIDATCKANVNQITETAKSVFKRDFQTPFGEGLKFTSVCKIRNNNSVSRTAILPCLGRIVQELNPLHTLCHDDPDLVIIVEVIRNICCLSVIKDYFKFKKYNLHEIVKTNDEGSDKSLKNETSGKKKIVTEQEDNTHTLEKEVDTDMPDQKDNTHKLVKEVDIDMPDQKDNTHKLVKEVDIDMPDQKDNTHKLVKEVDIDITEQKGITHKLEKEVDIDMPEQKGNTHKLEKEVDTDMPELKGNTHTLEKEVDTDISEQKDNTHKLVKEGDTDMSEQKHNTHKLVKKVDTETNSSSKDDIVPAAEREDATEPTG